MAETVRAETQTGKAYATLKSMIMENRLAPSASYLEQDLATELGMSRTPVREASLRLQSEGFVDIRPRLGIRVRPLSARDMSEIYDILTELEPYAAEQLAEKPLSVEERQRLEDIVAQMEAALERRDLRAWAEADRVFHTELITMAGNTRLLTIFQTLWDQVHRARMVTLTLRPLPVKSNADHRELVRLIAVGDATGARALHREHRAAAGAALVGLLEKHGLDNL